MWCGGAKSTITWYTVSPPISPLLLLVSWTMGQKSANRRGAYWRIYGSHQSPNKGNELDFSVSEMSACALRTSAQVAMTIVRRSNSAYNNRDQTSDVGWPLTSADCSSLITTLLLKKSRRDCVPSEWSHSFLKRAKLF